MRCGGDNRSWQRFFHSSRHDARQRRENSRGRDYERDSTSVVRSWRRVTFPSPPRGVSKRSRANDQLFCRGNARRVEPRGAREAHAATSYVATLRPRAENPCRARIPRSENHLLTIYEGKSKRAAVVGDFPDLVGHACDPARSRGGTLTSTKLRRDMRYTKR